MAWFRNTPEYHKFNPQDRAKGDNLGPTYCKVCDYPKEEWWHTDFIEELPKSLEAIL